MPFRISGNQRQRGLDWAVPKLGTGDVARWDKASCLILEKGNDIVACVVYTNWHLANSVEISIASLGRNWLTRPFLAAAFGNPFTNWRMRRVNLRIASNNLKSIRFAEHLGFVLEGRLREEDAPGVDTLVYGMKKEECRFLGADYNGEKRPGAHCAGPASDYCGPNSGE